MVCLYCHKMHLNLYTRVHITGDNENKESKEKLYTHTHKCWMRKNEMKKKILWRHYGPWINKLKAPMIMANRWKTFSEHFETNAQTHTHTEICCGKILFHSHHLSFHFRYFSKLWLVALFRVHHFEMAKIVWIAFSSFRGSLNEMEKWKKTAHKSSDSIRAFFQAEHFTRKVISFRYIRDSAG